MNNNSYKKITIICPQQFGYHTDYYKWCYHLPKHIKIKYICFDDGLIKHELQNVDIIYIKNTGHKIQRKFRFIIQCIQLIFNISDIIIVSYFKGCSLLKIALLGKKMTLDIRTESVDKKEFNRWLNNQSIILSTILFNKVIIVTNQLKKKFKLSNNKTFVVPLGADIISNMEKTNTCIKLLYVGTTHNRQLDKVLLGYSCFLKESNIDNISFDFIGSGPELSSLQRLAEELDIIPYIKFWGWIPNSELKPFFDKCNVGVSFVPITRYFDYQPPTKTYEYLLSGMFCIATKTKANLEIVSNENGILHNDTSTSFKNALIVLSKRFNNIELNQSNNYLKPHLWKSIVNQQLLSILDDL